MASPDIVMSFFLFCLAFMIHDNDYVDDDYYVAASYATQYVLVLMLYFVYL